jgi:hypothetical protein
MTVVGELLPGLVECSVVDRHSGRAGVAAEVVDGVSQPHPGAVTGTNSWMILA